MRKIMKFRISTMQISKLIHIQCQVVQLVLISLAVRIGTIVLYQRPSIKRIWNQFKNSQILIKIPSNSVKTKSEMNLLDPDNLPEMGRKLWLIAIKNTTNRCIIILRKILMTESLITLKAWIIFQACISRFGVIKRNSVADSSTSWVYLRWPIPTETLAKSKSC